jgi:hypothetical protein
MVRTARVSPEESPSAPPTPTINQRIKVQYRSKQTGGSEGMQATGIAAGAPRTAPLTHLTAALLGPVGHAKNRTSFKPLEMRPRQLCNAVFNAVVKQQHGRGSDGGARPLLPDG